MQKRLSIIIGVHKSWGSIEWILPVCKYLKDNYANVSIIFLILRKAKSEIFKENIEIKKSVDMVSNHQCYDLFDIMPEWINFISILIKRILTNFFYKWKSVPYNEHNRIYRYWFIFVKKVFWQKSMRKWIHKIDPDICLSDAYTEDLFRELKNNGVKIGFYPDATNLMFSPDLLPALTMQHEYFERLKNKSAFELSDYDFYLAETKYRANLTKNVVGKKSVFHVGPPDLDSFWLDYLIGKSKKGSGIILTNRYDNKILVLLQKEYAVNVYGNNFKNLLSEIISVCLKDKKAYLTLKPHPNLNRQLLHKIVDQYPRDRISISEEASIILIEVNDIVISMPTSVIYTAVLMGRPVIEYFNYSKAKNILKDKYHQIQNNILGIESIDDKGDITSIYRKLLNVRGANNPYELELLLKTDNEVAAQVGMNNLRGIFPDGACQKAAGAILTMKDQSIK